MKVSVSKTFIGELHGAEFSFLAGAVLEIPEETAQTYIEKGLVEPAAPAKHGKTAEKKDSNA